MYINRCGITGSYLYDNSVLTFYSSARQYSKAVAVLHSYQECMRVPVFLHPSIPVVILIIAGLVGMKWCPMISLIYIHLMADDVNHLFIWLLSNLYVLGECLHIFLPVFIFLIWLSFYCNSSLHT